MLDRLFRVENLLVIPLLLVALAVALGARWRGDPRHAGAARMINGTVRVGLAAVVVAIVFVLVLIVALGPIGP
jgi:hypothetical protein